MRSLLRLPVALLVLCAGARGAEPDLLEACRGMERDAGPGPLAPLIAEAMELIDRQRVDYASLLLQQRGVDPAQCPAVLRAVRPEWVWGLEERGVLVEWVPLEDDPLCFHTLRVTNQGQARVLTLPGEREFCVERNEEKPIVFEDFDFDGRMDLRFWARLAAGHSRRFDLILLRRADGSFVRSEILSSLDTLEVHPEKKQLSNRILDENHLGHRRFWRWKGGVLEAVK